MPETASAFVASACARHASKRACSAAGWAALSASCVSSTTPTLFTTVGWPSKTIEKATVSSVLSNAMSASESMRW